jgi:hypothetical protein
MINQIHIEGSTLCNGHCGFCPHDKVKRKEHLPFTLFKKIVDQGMDLGCSNFCPFRVNEPLLFPDLFLWLDYIRLKGGTVDLFTNGSLLDNVMAQRLIEYSSIINEIVFSFHGGTKESYEQTMGFSYDLVKDNILSFISLKPSFKYSIFSLIENDFQSFLQTWQDKGFSDIFSSRYLEWGGSITNNKTLLNDKENYKRDPCVRLTDQLDIMCNGLVCLCCMDAHGEVLFGDIKNDNLTDILNNSIRRYYIEKHLEGKSDELLLCKDCSMNLVRS